MCSMDPGVVYPAYGLCLHHPDERVHPNMHRADKDVYSWLPSKENHLFINGVIHITATISL